MTATASVNTTTQLLLDCFWALELSDQDRFDGGDLTARLRKRLRERGVRVYYSAATPKGSGAIHATEDRQATLCKRDVYGAPDAPFNPDSAYSCRRCVAAIAKVEGR
jgi:hypothetical protein